MRRGARQGLCPAILKASKARGHTGARRNLPVEAPSYKLPSSPNHQGDREMMDTLLVFAGILSAILTAFIVELCDRPVGESDMTATYLRDILSSMEDVRVLVPSLDPSPILTNSTVSDITGLWLCSLILSLSSALLAIVTRVWPRETVRGATRSHGANIGARRLNGDLMQLYLGAIVITVPLLLSAAVALFLFGILKIFWPLDPSGARLASTVGSGSTSFFLAIATMQAIHLMDCPSTGRLRTIYKASLNLSQVRLSMQMPLKSVHVLHWLRSAIVALLMRERLDAEYAQLCRAYPSWAQYNLNRAFHAMGWNCKPVIIHFSKCRSLRAWAWNCAGRLVHLVADMVGAQRRPDNPLHNAVLDASVVPQPIPELTMHTLNATTHALPGVVPDAVVGFDEH
ncbi:hypothetical protein HDZ31DRAFT_66235 [Schizophyllum fasciatum]